MPLAEGPAVCMKWILRTEVDSVFHSIVVEVMQEPCVKRVVSSEVSALNILINVVTT